MPQYKLYVAEPSGCPLHPLIVTTSYTNPGGYLKGEGFVVIPDTKETVLSFINRYTIQSFSEEGISIDENFMVREVLEQAKSKFRHYLYEEYIAKGQLADFRTSDVHEIDRQTFILYWYSHNYRRQIIEIRKATEYKSLDDFLAFLLRLPELNTQNL